MRTVRRLAIAVVAASTLAAPLTAAASGDRTTTAGRTWSVARGQGSVRGCERPSGTGCRSSSPVASPTTPAPGPARTYFTRSDEIFRALAGLG